MSIIGKISLAVVFLLFINSAFANNGKHAGYNLKKPDLNVVLPEILNEVSGLTYIDNETFACIQDEKGVLFIYSILERKIAEEYKFYLDGDYEGIARVDSSIYVLRSDGMLFEISNYKRSDFKIKSFSTGIPANNNEGLCYDPHHNRLLIACKGKSGKGQEFKDKREIYGFDLIKKELSSDPVFEFDLRRIKEYALENNINLPSKTKKKGETTEPFIRLMTSDIAIHPFTNKLYLLSAADHLFFIFNMKGEIEHMEKLDPHIFNKAEGITFLHNGDMLITNEAQNRKPTLLRFNYQTK